MSAAWINDYVGVPYVENGRNRRTGWDCWGLVLTVYRDRLGVDLPDWTWPEPFGPLDKLRAFARAVRATSLTDALELAAPEAWAIVLVRGAANVAPHHVGVCVDAGGALGVLHAQRYGGTVYDPMGRFLAQNARLQWFRWQH